MGDATIDFLNRVEFRLRTRDEATEIFRDQLAPEFNIMAYPLQ